MARSRIPRLGALWRDERGQAAVEFAIVVMLLLAMGFGGIEFGRAFHAYQAVNYAAREGARYGMNPAVSVSDIQTYAVAAANLSGTTATASRQTSPNGVTVQVTYPFSTSVPLVSALWGGGTLSIAQTRVARSP